MVNEYLNIKKALKVLDLAIVVKITIQWIPGNCNIAGNEAADAAAKSAAKTDGPVHPISFNSACTLIRKIIKDPPNTHPRTHKVYSALSRDQERLINSREDQFLLILATYFLH